MAHHQIWMDWVWQGNRGVDVKHAKDTDILVVFEDDAVIAVKNVTKALQAEFLEMSTDLLFLVRPRFVCTDIYRRFRQNY